MNIIDYGILLLLPVYLTVCVYCEREGFASFQLNHLICSLKTLCATFKRLYWH